MSDDPMQWLVEKRIFQRHHTGEDLAPNDLANEFLKMNLVSRTNTLAQLDAKIAAAHLSLEDAAKLHRFRKRLIDAHTMARRVGR